MIPDTTEGPNKVATLFLPKDQPTRAEAKMITKITIHLLLILKISIQQNNQNLKMSKYLSSFPHAKMKKYSIFKVEQKYIYIMFIMNVFVVTFMTFIAFMIHKE